ncbi:uncharacterized protein LOC120336650 isoform X1 [Styela clava]
MFFHCIYNINFLCKETSTKMGLFKLIQYPKHRRRRKKLKIDMRALALRDSITSLMKDEKYLEAMRQIKEIWTLKTSPWTYSSSILNYIECLIRKQKFRDIATLEKEVLNFYEKILDISPRRLMKAAHEVMDISSRPLQAALLAFYAARLALSNKKKEPAMKHVKESVELIRNANSHLSAQKSVTGYLLSLLRELRDHVNAISTKAKTKLKSDCIETCNNLITEIRTQQKLQNSQPRLRKSRKSRRKSSLPTKLNNNQRSIHREKGLPSTSSEDNQEYADTTSGKEVIEDVEIERVIEENTLKME